MIPSQALIADFQRMLAERWGYIPGTAGETWTQQKQDASTNEQVKKYGQQWVGRKVADCSGAFVWAYKQHGMSIYHGSNRIAREYVVTLLPVSQALPGMAAFKARKPGEQLYDLPSQYRQGGKEYNGDLNDYYHIGVVDEDPRYVLNSQGTRTGFVRSSIDSSWSAVAYLSAVDYDDKGDKPMVEEKMMIVTTDKVNLRTAPDKSATRVEYLNTGDAVTVKKEYGNGWVFAQHRAKQGYMLSQYLRPAEQTNEPAQSPADGEALTWLQRALEANKQERQALTMLQRMMTGAVG